MLTEVQQRRVFENMFASDIRANYFADLSGRYLKLQQWGTWATLAFATSAAASFLAQLPPNQQWIQPMLAAATAALTLYITLAQYDRKAIDASNLQGRHARLNRAFEALWENVYAEDALKTLRALEEEVDVAAIAANGLRNDQKAMAHWQEHIEREYQARYV